MAARFNTLYQQQALEGVPVSVRIPTAFTVAPMIEGRGQVDPRRVTPGIVTLPSLKLTYEMTIKDDKGQLPYYCYVGAVKATEKPLEDACKTLQAALTAKPGAEVSQWADFDGETPDGHESKWKKLRCVAQTRNSPTLMPTDRRIPRTCRGCWRYTFAKRRGIWL